MGLRTFIWASLLWVGATAHAESQAPETSKAHAVAENLMYKASDAVARGDMPMALDTLRHCVSVDKAYPRCPRILAILYGKQGEQKKAAAYYRVYLKEAPKAPDASAVRALLREYDND